MKDFLDQELTIGDEVAFYVPGYRSFVKGVIIAFTPKQIRVSYTNTWNYGNPGSDMTFLSYPNAFIKTNT